MLATTMSDLSKAARNCTTTPPKQTVQAHRTHSTSTHSTGTHRTSAQRNGHIAMARTARAHNASMEDASAQKRRHAQQAHTYLVPGTRAWATQDNMHPLSRSTAVPQGLGEGDRKGSVCKSGGNRSNSWPSALERCLRLHHQVDRPCTQTCQLHASASRDSAQHKHTQHEHTAHKHGHTQRTAWGAQTSAARVQAWNVVRAKRKRTRDAHVARVSASARCAQGIYCSDRDGPPAVRRSATACRETNALSRRGAAASTG